MAITVSTGPGRVRCVARSLEVDDADVQDVFAKRGWTDGLPVVPPAVDRVKAMLAADSRPPETVVAVHPATGLDLSLHSAAVNAVKK